MEMLKEENRQQAIINLLLLNSAKLSCIREELAVITAVSLHKPLQEIQDLGSQRLKENFEKLKDKIFEHYGNLDFDDLLNH
jgi:hypothetical protein